MKKEKQSKQKMVVMVPLQSFGFERRAYRAGEKYIIAQSELPTALKGKYKTQSVKKAKTEDEAKAKAKAKKIPVVG